MLLYIINKISVFNFQGKLYISIASTNKLKMFTSTFHVISKWYFSKKHFDKLEKEIWKNVKYIKINLCNYSNKQTYAHQLMIKLN